MTVIEMAGLGPCPFAGQMLADLGATVVVIDRDSASDLSGDINRRGKKSVAIDVKSSDGCEIVLRLCKGADILIEGFRPGVMERLGLGPQAVHAQNPAVIYGRMTGWGQDGPLAACAGHDITYLAITGALHAMGEADKPPVPPLNLVADYGGGSMFLLTGVLAALFERTRSGKGQIVDAAMADGVPAMMGLVHSMLNNGLWQNRRESNLLDGGAPFYRCYACADGKFVAVGALEPQFFAILVEKTGVDPEWRKMQIDRARWAQLAATLAAKFITRSRDEWAKLFEGSDGCVAPVLDFHEAASHPHNVARGTFRADGGKLSAAPAPRFSRSKGGVPEPFQLSGNNSREVLMNAGYTAEAIDDLKRNGVLR